jgi:hypothetical protein
MSRASLPQTASGDNRVNTSGMVIGTVKNRTSLVYTNTIADGQILPIPCAGTQFYLLISTGPIDVRPSGGVFNTYSQGQGLQLDLENAFTQLEVRNSSGFPVVFRIFVGFDGFIDNTLILNVNPNGSQQVAYPTYPTPNSAAHVDIPDLSGQSFRDVNGKQWYALARVAIIISDTDTGVTFLLQKSGASTASGEAVCAIFPQTSIRMDIAGDYSMDLGGANLNCLVSEIYNALAA